MFVTFLYGFNQYEATQVAYNDLITDNCILVGYLEDYRFEHFKNRVTKIVIQPSGSYTFEKAVTSILCQLLRRGVEENLRHIVFIDWNNKERLFDVNSIRSRHLKLDEDIIRRSGFDSSGYVLYKIEGF